MAMALPGANGLFYLLQEAFRHEEPGINRLRLTAPLHGFPEDFQLLAADISSRPTRIAKVVLDVYPATLGACDAARTVIGGIHFIPDDDSVITPILWQEPFPVAIS